MLLTYTWTLVPSVVAFVVSIAEHSKMLRIVNVAAVCAYSGCASGWGGSRGRFRSSQWMFSDDVTMHLYQHTHTHLAALFPGLPGWAGTRKVKPIWILLKQETVSGSGISWAICKSALCSRQITTPAPHNSVFFKPSRLPTNSVKALKARALICTYIKLSIYRAFLVGPLDFDITRFNCTCSHDTSTSRALSVLTDNALYKIDAYFIYNKYMHINMHI